MKEVIQKLEQSNLRKTAIRKEVLQLFLKAKGNALSSRDIESQLENPDRITLYRTLRTFEEKGLIHQAVDGSGKNRYALCSDDCEGHDHHDEHAHFHCKKCDKTICLEDVHVPSVNLSNDYQLEHAQLVLTGVCSNCQQEKTS